MSYKQKLKDIKAFVLDVDGVFTDGTIYLMPDQSMSRAMSVLDGYAVVKALKKGYQFCVITGGDDPGVRHRIQYLGIQHYYAKSPDKRIDLEDFKRKTGIIDSEMLMMGDDIPDIEILQLAAIGACPANAVPEVKNVADYISPVRGGQGAVRDVIEQVMKVQGTWYQPDNTQSV